MENESLRVLKSEYERLLEEINILRGVIASLTSERDDLKYNVCREIAADYDTKVGNLELQVLIAGMRVMELKRTVEILQAKINRQERASEKQAREQAQQEYQQFQEDLNRKAEEAKQARDYQQEKARKEEEWRQEQEQKRQNGQEGSEGSEGAEQQEEQTGQEQQDEQQSETGGASRKYSSRQEEMKALYRKIVKALHPDTNPNQTEEMKRMFREAVEAYNRGDLDKLREIAAMLDQGDGFEEKQDESPKSIEILKELIDSLKWIIEVLKEEIEQIKSSFPYTMKDLLQDEQWVAEKREKLSAQLKEYCDQIEELEARIKEMTGKSGRNGRKKEE